MATAIKGPNVHGIERPSSSTSTGLAERLAPLTGVAVLILGLAGLVVWEGVADRPEFDQPPGVMLDYFQEGNAVILGGFLMMLAAVFFVWFAGYLRGVLQAAEGGTGRLGALAFAGGVAAAVFMLAMPAANLTGAVYADQLGLETARTFFLFGNVFLYPAAMAAAVLVAATGVAALRTGALPAWLGWLSLVLALWLLIPPVGSGAGTPENPAAWTGLAALPAVPIWTALTAALLMRRGAD